MHLDTDQFMGKINKTFDMLRRIEYEDMINLVRGYTSLYTDGYYRTSKGRKPSKICKAHGWTIKDLNKESGRRKLW